MGYYHCREIGGMRSSCRFTLVGGDKAMCLIKKDDYLAHNRRATIGPC